MLSVPSYREGWERKRRWYQDKLSVPVVGDGGTGIDADPGKFPVVITSRDGDDGGIDVPRIEELIRKYIVLEG